MRTASARAARTIAIALYLSGGGGVACRDRDVVTASYATLPEAVAAGAVTGGQLPDGLPPGTRDIRVAYDRGGGRHWGLFEFPPGEGDALAKMIGADVPFGGLRCNPPRRIEWWPVQLRGDLDGERLGATGLRVYERRTREGFIAVHWQQGRAYYWTADQ